TGVKLDRVATHDSTAPATEGASMRANLVAALASTGDDELDDLLAATHVKFVVLAVGASGEASLLRSSLQAVFDQHPALTPVGDTQHGILWRVNDAPTVDGATGEPEEPADAAADRSGSALAATDRPLSGRAIWGIQLAV